MQDKISWVRLWFYRSDPRMLFENWLDVNGKIFSREPHILEPKVSNFLLLSLWRGNGDGEGSEEDPERT